MQATQPEPLQGGRWRGDGSRDSAFLCLKLQLVCFKFAAFADCCVASGRGNHIRGISAGGILEQRQVWAAALSGNS